MGLGFIRLVLAVFWFVLGLAVLFRNYLQPGGLLERMAGSNGDVVGLLGIGLAGWNLVRWYGARPAPSEPVIVRREVRDRNRPDEYLPEFDFTKPDPPAESR